MELDSIDLGRESEVAHGELDLDCGDPGRVGNALVGSTLDLLGGAAESIIFLKLSRSPGTSRHSSSKTNNLLLSLL